MQNSITHANKSPDTIRIKIVPSERKNVYSVAFAAVITIQRPKSLKRWIKTLLMLFGLCRFRPQVSAAGNMVIRPYPQFGKVSRVDLRIYIRDAEGKSDGFTAEYTEDDRADG